MMAVPKPASRLKVPQSVEALDACLQVVLTIPQMVDLQIAAIEQLTEQVSVIALYFQKKGLAEGIFSDEDFEKTKEAEGDAGDKA